MALGDLYKVDDRFLWYGFVKDKAYIDNNEVEENFANLKSENGIIHSFYTLSEVENVERRLLLLEIWH